MMQKKSCIIRILQNGIVPNKELHWWVRINNHAYVYGEMIGPNTDYSMVERIETDIDQQLLAKLYKPPDRIKNLTREIFEIKHKDRKANEGIVVELFEQRKPLSLFCISDINIDDVEENIYHDILTMTINKIIEPFMGN